MITPSEYKIMCHNGDAEIEQAIDAAIRNSSRRGMGITIQVRRHWSREAIDTVLRSYQLLGWRANYVDDWRDGDYLALEAP